MSVQQTPPAPAAPADPPTDPAARRTPLRAGELLLVAFAIALLSAFGEMALIGLQMYVLDIGLHIDASMVWMTPVSVVALFAVPALALLLLTGVWRTAGRMAVVAGVCLFIGSASVLLIERRVGIWALLILSAGVAVQGGRLAERFRPRVLRALRFVAPALVVLVLLLAATVEGGRALAERRGVAQLAPARAGAPNVLFIILDTVRALNMSLYGYERATTPELARYAARGIVFDRAIVPGTWTVPSHASMLTGRWPHELTAWWTSPDRRSPYPTLPEFLGRHGYRTGGFIGNWFHIGRTSGLDQGFLHFSDLDRSPAQISRGSALIRWVTSKRWYKRVVNRYETHGRRRAPSVTRALMRWAGSDSERPFFAFVNYFDAHSPYFPPPPFDSRFGEGVADREPLVIEELNRVAVADPEVVRKERDAYDGGIAYLDHEIGGILDELDRQGVLDNTIVIVTADHGEELGEHGRFGHAYSLHGEIVHVPLLLLAPGGPRGIRVDAPTSLRNLAATIADLAGLVDAPFPGSSLARHWTPGTAVPADTAFSEFDEQRSLYSDRYHWFTGVMDGRDYLYDHRVDLRELHNLADSPESLPVIASMRALATAVSPLGAQGLGAPVPAEK